MSNCFIVSLRIFVSLLSLCLEDLSIDVSVVLQFLIIVFLSVSSCMCVSIYFMYLDACILGAYMLCNIFIFFMALFKKELNHMHLFLFGYAGSSLLCGGFLCLRWAAVPLQSRCTGVSLVEEPGLQSYRLSICSAHRLNCLAACVVFPFQGSNPCPLH